MFQNAIIDVAIGLILMYLMLSLLCTVVNEYISTKLNLRSKTLRDALKKLIDDPALLKNFYEHGLITSSSQASGSGAQSLLQAAATWVGAYHSLKNQVAPPTTAGAATATPVEAEHPSYLASGTVALALLGSLLKKTPGTLDVAGITAAINALTGPTGDPKIKDALKASLLKAGNDIDQLQQGIATWFDDSMDRLSGAYKRKMKWIAMLIGLLVAIAFNADSFNVATTLWNDPERRASTIAIATQAATTKKSSSASTQATTEQDLRDAVTDSEKMLRTLPIGWQCLAPACTGSGSRSCRGSGTCRGSRTCRGRGACRGSRTCRGRGACRGSGICQGRSSAREVLGEPFVALAQSNSRLDPDRARAQPRRAILVRHAEQIHQPARSRRQAEAGRPETVSQPPTPSFAGHRARRRAISSRM
jgi:hypothetical protein